jgi:hypothetical protein
MLLQSAVASFTSLSPASQFNILVHVSWQTHLAEATLAALALDDHMMLQQEVHIESWDISLVHTEKGHVLSVFANTSW